MTEQAPRDPQPQPGLWRFLEDLRAGGDRRSGADRRQTERRRGNRPPGRSRRSLERRTLPDRRRHLFETFDEGDAREIRTMLLDAAQQALCPRCGARLLRAAGGNERTIVVCTGCYARLEVEGG